MDVFTPRIVGFGVESAYVDGVSVCKMFNRASAGQSLPQHASTDHDPLFRFHRWLANLRVLEIEQIKSGSICSSLASLRQTAHRDYPA